MKRITALLLTFFLVVSPYVVTPQGINEFYNSYEIYNKLIGLYKNNAITECNLVLLTNQPLAESYDELVIILNEEKDTLQKQVARKQLERATENKFLKISSHCAGLVGSIPLGGMVGELYSRMLIFITNNINNNKSYQVNNYNTSIKSTLFGIFKSSKEIDTTTIAKSYNRMSDDENIRKLSVLAGCVVGAVVALSFGEQLYRYFTDLKNLESKIKCIDNIIVQLDALKKADCTTTCA